MKKTFSPDQKGRIALEAVKGIKSLAQLASECEAHLNVIGQWKKIVQDNIGSLFADRHHKEHRDKDELIERLYALVGQRDAELAWLKKKLRLESS